MSDAIIAGAPWGILLGGGRSSRMGTDKIALRLDGETLGRRALDALLRVSEKVVVVSPPRPDLEGPRVEFTLEEPPFGGPVAGIAAGLACIEGDGDVYVLAGDLADPGSVVATLALATSGPDGVALVDPQGWPQYLAARYSVAALRGALAGPVRDRSVRRSLAGLRLALVRVGGAIAADLDTPEQARHAGASAPGVQSGWSHPRVNPICRD